MRKRVHAWGLAFAVACGATGMRASADPITLPAHGTVPAITGNLVKPAGAGPFPAILVLHGCGDYGDLETGTVKQLASQGYVARDRYARTAAPTKRLHRGRAADRERRDVRIRSARLARATAVRDRRSSRRRRLFDGRDRSARTGRSPHAAHAAGRIARGRRYYPACNNRRPDVSVPLQILDGTADDWSPSPPCQDLAQSATAAGKTVQITTYPGVTHAFNQPSNGEHVYLGHVLRYDPAATADAIAKTDAFFATYLK